MKEIKVIVRDRNTLVLAEDALKGDIINLASLEKIDSSAIINAIEKGKDEVYEKRISEASKTISLELENEKAAQRATFEKKIDELVNQINQMKANAENEAKIKENEIRASLNDTIVALNKKIDELKYQATIEEKANTAKIEKIISQNDSTIATLTAKKDNEIDSLKKDIKAINESIQVRIDNNKLTLKNDYEKQITSLKNEIEALKKENETNLSVFELKAEKKYSEIIEKQKEELTEVIRKKEDEVNLLKNQKIQMSVKAIGEDLEKWCDNEVRSYMQNGFANCSWMQDTISVADEDLGDTKRTKADYIFRIYSDNKHTTELSSICFDMKDESPDSVNKKKESTHFAKLDKDRVKKNCKYAVLVSNLDTDRPNELPMYKVNEYADMYVVRPAYLMTFINMITSLTNRFVELIVSQQEEQQELLNQTKLMEQFDSLKATYLDKPLEGLAKHIEDISKQSSAIKQAANKIDESCLKITTNYIAAIETKLSKFEISLGKAYKKL